MEKENSINDIIKFDKNKVQFYLNYNLDIKNKLKYVFNYLKNKLEKNTSLEISNLK